MMHLRLNPAELVFPEGTPIGQYTIERPLARGGIAAVYVAVQKWSGQRVALKCVNFGSELDVGQRFRREAITLAQVSGEHLVRYFDANETPGGVMWIAMELMASNLRTELYERWRERQTGLSLEESLDMLEGVAEGLASLHQRRILHRDIKPENIGIAADGTIKVLDFGLVKFLDRVFQTTEKGVIPGTPAYMAPEQLTGMPLSGATDLYALGITFYETLTGLHPFAIDRKNRLPQDVAFMQQVRDLPPIPGLPAPVGRLMQRMTKKNPAARISTASELLSEIRQIRKKPSVKLAPSKAFTGAVSTYHHSSARRVSSPKMVLLRSAAVGGAMAAAGLAAIFVLGAKQGPEEVLASEFVERKPATAPGTNLVSSSTSTIPTSSPEETQKSGSVEQTSPSMKSTEEAAPRSLARETTSNHLDEHRLPFKAKSSSVVTQSSKSAPSSKTLPKKPADHSWMDDVKDDYPWAKPRDAAKKKGKERADSPVGFAPL